MTYRLAQTTTTYKNERGDWVVYNWLNTSYSILFERDHPFYRYLERLESESDLVVAPEAFDAHGADLAYLLEHHFLVENAQQIAREVERRFTDSRDVENTPLSLILLPAGEACNFNCVYCYQDHTQKSRMGSEHEEAIVALVAARKPPFVQIEYFGGEPLLNQPFIRRLNRQLVEWCTENGSHFASSATTNGYLLDDTALATLYETGLRNYQVTLDGLAQHHNKLRMLANGKPTFDRIVDNLRNAARRKDLDGLRITIRVNFNQTNSSPEDIARYLDFIHSITGGDPRFSILFRGIGDYASRNDRTADQSCVVPNDLEEALRHAYEDAAHARGLRLAESELLVPFGGSSCYAGKPNSFVISPDLSLKKCTVALDLPVNHVGRLGRDGELLLEENFYRWTAPRLFSKKGCQTCHFVSQCQSNACPLENMEQDISVCPPQKHQPVRFVRQILKQEVSYE